MRFYLSKNNMRFYMGLSILKCCLISLAVSTSWGSFLEDQEVKEGIMQFHKKKLMNGDHSVGQKDILKSVKYMDPLKR